MDAPEDDYEIQFFRIDESGDFILMHENFSHKYSGIIPNVGDEIPCPMSWIGGMEDFERNGFLIIRRRVFFKSESRVAMVCEYRQATKHDYELF